MTDLGRFRPYPQGASGRLGKRLHFVPAELIGRLQALERITPSLDKGTFGTKTYSRYIGKTGGTVMHRVLMIFAAASMLTGAAHAQATAPAQPTPPAGPLNAVQIPQDAIMSGKLEELEVRNAVGEDVGEIEDAVISQGRVVGYIISVGGFLGVGDRNIVVDPSLVTTTYNSSDNRWEGRINATKEQLQAIPEFKYEGRWDDSDDDGDD